MSKKVSLNIIGAGFIANELARALMMLDHVEIYGVYSRSIEKAREFARRHNINNIYDDWRRAVSDPHVEAVVIATPNYTHKEISVEAARRGKHIFLEKPIATRLRDAHEIIEEAERNRVKLFVGHCLRYWPEYVRVREMILRGEIGEPRIVRVYRLSSFPKWSIWHRYMSFSGGVAVDLAIHDIDYLRWSIGEVSKVYAVGGVYTRYSVDAIDHVMYILEFENEAIGYGEASWAMPESFPFTTYLEIAGTKGLLYVDNRSTATYNEYIDDKIITSSPYDKNAYYNELKAFIRWILYDEPVEIRPEDALESLRIALAINKSIEKKEIIDVKKADLE